MTKFYKSRILKNESKCSYLINLKCPNGEQIEVEVTERVFAALEDMQKEFWRLEKRESYHTGHIEMISPSNMSEPMRVPSPERLMMEHLEKQQLYCVLRELPPLQLRRFLLRNYFGLSLKQIASIEGCSIQTAQKSISRAQKNLQKKFGENG